MYFKVARTVNLLVIVLMTLQILGASIASLPSVSDHCASIHSQKTPSSVLGSFLFEKTEEETKKFEEENGRLSRVVLIDFSSIALSLSAYHSPNFEISIHTFRYDVRPPVHQLNCVFVI